MLARYAKKAALFATENKSVKLPHTEWALIPRGCGHHNYMLDQLKSAPMIHVENLKKSN